MVHHCPRCPLRFRTEAELKEHAVLEHGVAAEALERDRYHSAHEQEPLYDDLPERRAGKAEHDEDEARG